MPPASSQKGTGKKGAGAIARQRSRNTTPSSMPPSASLPPIATKTTEFLDLTYDSFRDVTYEDVVDQNGPNSHMPESRSLDGIMTRFQKLQDILERRSAFCDRGMRRLVEHLKASKDEVAAERSREEERQRAEDEERARKANKANKKKRKAADTLAPQDASIGQSQPFELQKKHPIQCDSEFCQVISYACHCMIEVFYLSRFFLFPSAVFPYPLFSCHICAVDLT